MKNAGLLDLLSKWWIYARLMDYVMTLWLIYISLFCGWITMLLDGWIFIYVRGEDVLPKIPLYHIQNQKIKQNLISG